MKQQLITHSKGWRGINNPWMAEGEEDEQFQYINLLVNPERYTGYKVGSSSSSSSSSGCHTPAVGVMAVLVGLPLL
jgi:hypothetical protein